jgi:Flp pilus assembly protein CpaB
MVVGDPSPGSAKVSYNTVTLEVTPSNAQRLILAQSIGKIVVVLRNPDDFEDPFLDQLKATQLLEDVIEEDKDMIRYILGGSPQDGSPKIVKKAVVSGPPILQLAGAGEEGAPDLGSLVAPT